MSKLEIKKQKVIDSIKAGNLPTEIMQNQLSKAGLVVDSRWNEEALMNEKMRDLNNLYTALNGLNTVGRLR